MEKWTKCTFDMNMFQILMLHVICYIIAVAESKLCLGLSNKSTSVTGRLRYFSTWNLFSHVFVSK